MPEGLKYFKLNNHDISWFKRVVDCPQIKYLLDKKKKSILTEKLDLGSRSKHSDTYRLNLRNNNPELVKVIEQVVQSILSQHIPNIKHNQIVLRKYGNNERLPPHIDSITHNNKRVDTIFMINIQGKAKEVSGNIKTNLFE